MAKRVDKNRLRFMPRHLALEGYLALRFGGPTVVWDEWSQRAAFHDSTMAAELLGPQLRHPAGVPARRLHAVAVPPRNR